METEGEYLPPPLVTPTYCITTEGVPVPLGECDYKLGSVNISLDGLTQDQIEALLDSLYAILNSK